MNSFKGIQFLFFSRGFSRWVDRFKTIFERFGFTPGKQMKIILSFSQCLKAHGVRGNFFIPAVLLKKYCKHLRKVDRDTIEWGIHGLNHTDHSALDYETQKSQLKKAIEIFDSCGFKFTGFRCPYLHFNEHTQAVLKELGRFEFDSSCSVVHQDFYGATKKYFTWIKDFYHAKSYSHGALKVEYVAGLPQIPVSLPDDDITIDREKWTSSEIYQLWESMLKRCHENNEVFVLQLHPERFLEAQDILPKLISAAKSFSPPVWIATLGEVAAQENFSPGRVVPQGYRGVFCITGDIDAIVVQDFFWRLVKW